MTAPSPPKKKKILSCAAFSCLGCLGIAVLAVIVLVIVLAIADARIDHSEKLISSSTDYAAFIKKSKVTFGPNVVSCEWALKGKDNRKLLSLSALVPSPSDYDVIVSGFVILSEEESKRILAEYDCYEKVKWMSRLFRGFLCFWVSNELITIPLMRQRL